MVNVRDKTNCNLWQVYLIVLIASLCNNWCDGYTGVKLHKFAINVCLVWPARYSPMKRYGLVRQPFISVGRPCPASVGRGRTVTVEGSMGANCLVTFNNRKIRRVRQWKKKTVLRGTVTDLPSRVGWSGLFFFFFWWQKWPEKQKINK